MERTTASLPACRAIVEVSTGGGHDGQHPRQQGFAVNADEALDGLASVAAPVLGRDGSAKAAISIVGPSDRLRNGIGRPARLVQVAARRLSKELCL